jgi:pyoverdine/dityrosine biosynthesis protein Dit1
MADTITTLTEVISQYAYCFKQKSSLCTICCNKIELILTPLIEQTKPIHFVLPAFPAKSANRDKTLSDLPDLGEALALEKLNRLIVDIKAAYSPGAALTICSDGHVFNDLVGVTDDAVIAYQTMLKHCCQELAVKNISFCDLTMIYKHQDYSRMRQQLILDFGKQIEEIHQDVLSDKDEELFFCGLHRFLCDDLAPLMADHSKNQIKKAAKLRAYLTIQRSHAWSKLIEHHYPDSLRLSIHPHYCHSPKLPIKLIDNANRWATPWHNVVVKIKDQVHLMKQSQAIKMGAQLSPYTHPWQRFYSI